MKKLITKKEARDKYGIIVMKHHDYKYYLLPNGNVVDSDGDIRYTKPDMTTEEIIEALRKIQASIEHDRYTIENIDALIAKLNK